MVNSGSINGVPATASHYLLTDILRKQMGFQGVVISDYQDVPALQTAYHVAADLAGAIAKAVNAGVDMSMQVFDADKWQAAILQDVHDRRDLDGPDQPGGAADPHPEVPARPVRPAVRQQPQHAVRRRRRRQRRGHRRTGRHAQAARESITLLRNQNNTLPLSRPPRSSSPARAPTR